MADGILTQAEETKVREFRDRLALSSVVAHPEATAQLRRAASERAASLTPPVKSR